MPNITTLDGTHLAPNVTAIVFDPTDGWSLLLPADEQETLSDESMLLTAVFMLIHENPEWCRQMVAELTALAAAE